MRFYKILKVIISASLFGMAICSNASINKQDIVDTCVKTGDDVSVCQCVSNKWLDSLTSNEMKLAEKLVNYMKTDTQPPANEMEKYSSVINKYRKLGMQCAMSVDVEQEQQDFDIGAYIPKGAMTEQDLKDLNSIASGNGKAMENLKSMEAREQQRREAEQQKNSSYQAQSDAQLAKIRAQYKA